VYQTFSYFLVLGLGIILSASACSARKGNLPEMSSPMEVPYLNYAFQEGSIVQIGSDKATIEVLEIGALNLPNGQIIATDPFTDPDRSAFVHQVPPGNYPVILSLVSFKGLDWKTIAAAMVRFSQAEPKTWHLALIPGQDTSTLAQDEIFGYPVDSGTGAFLSPQAAKLHKKSLFALPSIPNIKYMQTLSDQMDQNKETGYWLVTKLDEPDINAAFFSSGYGDGFYASYWGVAEDGEVVCLVTDFDILEGSN
jgi:hypothetical protein